MALVDLMLAEFKPICVWAKTMLTTCLEFYAMWVAFNSPNSFSQKPTVGARIDNVGQIILLWLYT